MILTDKEIKERSKDIFKKNYNLNDVQPISYDVHIDEIIDEKKNVLSYDLEPHEIIMVRCKEEIIVPNDLAIRIENKNSLIRLGLSVTSPIYNPGHETPIYIRVENVSGNIITIEKDMTIAQMIFEQLSSIPTVTYNIKENASFNNENKYRGLGKYNDILSKKTQKMEKVKEDLENREASIYANILTMMGIFVSIFSLITVNFASINEKNFNKDFILTMNLSLGIVITLFMGLILLFLNRSKSKWGIFVFIGVLILLTLMLFFII
ncbi:dCTP deaminase [Thomasclavelia cocleata]|uniref:dCTP deaminase n=1 Tax=Thomasclavelia cocleata TaxID=69824 RepID=UPI0024325510|nr:hypothetical protein [Thomasclavelia cocleata]